MTTLSATSATPELRLGLCCLNTVLRSMKPPVFASRSCIQATLLNKGYDYVRQLARQNIADIHTMMRWNYEHGIYVFRLSSDIFPHITNPVVDRTIYTLDDFVDELAELGEVARRYNQRISFHPAQFNVLGTPNPKALQQTIYELHIHATILDMMGCDSDSTMVIHGGGIYGDKEATMKRWCRNYRRLPAHIRNRLVLENCEKAFSLEDCLKISEEINIPIVLDNHHYDCYKLLHPKDIAAQTSIEDYIPRVLETWRRRGIRPEFHLSEQGCGRIGHHSDYISQIPEYYKEIPSKYGMSVDIMIEAKMKEQAILQLRSQLPMSSF